MEPEGEVGQSLTRLIAHCGWAVLTQRQAALAPILPV
jgi:hypothetical protein